MGLYSEKSLFNIKWIKESQLQSFPDLVTIEVSVIILAVLAIIQVLQTFSFKFYKRHKSVRRGLFIIIHCEESCQFAHFL